MVGGTGALTSANQLSSTGYNKILGNQLTGSSFIYLPISEGFVTAGAGERPLACVQTKMALQYPRPVESLVAEWAGMTATIIASAVVIVYFYCRLLYMCISYFIINIQMKHWKYIHFSTNILFTAGDIHLLHQLVKFWHLHFCLLGTYCTLLILAVNLWHRFKTYTIAWFVQFSQWILTVKAYFLEQW